MIFPTAAVLFWVWFLLTPAIRIGLYLFGRRFSRLARLVLAHTAAFVIMMAATAIALSGPELGGMAVMFAIGQFAFFVLDFFRMRPEEGI